MHCITLLFKCNALYYTLLFTQKTKKKISNKQNMSILKHLLQHIIKQMLSYTENSLHYLFLISCFIIVVSKKCQCVQEFQCSFCRKDSRILNQYVKIIY